MIPDGKIWEEFAKIIGIIPGLLLGPLIEKKSKISKTMLLWIMQKRMGRKENSE